MKIEYKIINTYTREVPFSKELKVVNEYGIYITKNEVVKNYEGNKELFMDKLNSLTEMLTTPHCFNTNIWYKDWDYKNGYDYDKVDEIISLMKKTTYKGLLLYVSEDANDGSRFVAKVLKK